MLDDPLFWPDGIICKPWQSRGMQNNVRNRFNSKKVINQSAQQCNRVGSSYDFEGTNRYSLLTSDID